MNEENYKLRINDTFISKWHPVYDKLESDEGKYHAIISDVASDISQSNSISKNTFINILDWKASRLKGIVKLNEYGEYEKAISDCIKSREERKVSIIVELYGIGLPLGTTILHFIYPNSFPIMDIRTAETLLYAGYIESDKRDLNRYPILRSTILKIVQIYPKWNLRQIDRALFAFHKSNPEIFLKKNTKTKKYKHISSSSIPVIIKSICEKLGANGAVIYRKDIIAEAEKQGLNRSSVLPADYCDNTKTGDWSPHTFLHSLGPGRYILSRYS